MHAVPYKGGEAIGVSPFGFVCCCAWGFGNLAETPLAATPVEGAATA